MPKDGPIFSFFAVSRTGNRGAVSMLESAIDHLTAEACGGTVHVFTVYPKQDQRAKPRPKVDLLNGSPFNLAFKLIPLCLLYCFTRLLRLPIPDALWGKEMGALLESDVCVIAGGTTFTDAQVFKVPYNVACILPALLLGKRSMLYSQTLGPFKHPFNRCCARFCLRRVDLAAPRGQGSWRCVQDLGIPNAPDLADSAFTLEVPAETEARIRDTFQPLLAGKTVVGISVNSIVERKCTALGIDHNRIWAEFIQYLQREGYFVLLVPHSLRLNSTSRHNNDLMTIADILELLPNRENLHIVDEPYDCKELRVVVGLADYYVASRFHSMISALCTKTPVTVFGWGHQKYREVMAQFGLEACCHDAADLSKEALAEGLARIIQDAAAIKEQIRENLPAVQASSMRNHEEALRLAHEAQAAPSKPNRRTS